MDLNEFGLLTLCVILVLVLVVELLLVWIVASVVASFFGVSGLAWWAVAIVTFIIINGVLAKLRG